jgi:hypothetical protein
MKAKTDTAAEFSQCHDLVTKALKRLVQACLTSSEHKSDGGALDAARKAMDKRWTVFAKRFASHAEFEGVRHHVAQLRARLGDDFFYDRGNYRQAITEYEASLALDAHCMDALSGIVATYLQGTLDPAAALPYAIRRAELNPGRQRDVDYIRGLLSQRP